MFVAVPATCLECDPVAMAVEELWHVAQRTAAAAPIMVFFLPEFQPTAFWLPLNVPAPSLWQYTVLHVESPVGAFAVYDGVNPPVEAFIPAVGAVRTNTYPLAVGWPGAVPPLWQSLHPYPYAVWLRCGVVDSSV